MLRLSIITFGFNCSNEFLREIWEKLFVKVVHSRQIGVIIYIFLPLCTDTHNHLWDLFYLSRIGRQGIGFLEALQSQLFPIVKICFLAIFNQKSAIDLRALIYCSSLHLENSKDRFSIVDRFVALSWGNVHIIHTLQYICEWFCETDESLWTSIT
jgi:hypothetical protein